MIKGSEAQKQRSHKLLWMLWFDEKTIPNVAYRACIFFGFQFFVKNEEKDDFLHEERLIVEEKLLSLKTDIYLIE